MKERLTGAFILVALIVLLVPEVLTGPIRSAPRAVATSAGEPPLRSYTINLGDEAHSKPAEAQAAESPSPAPVPLPAIPAAIQQESLPAAPPVADSPAPTPEPKAAPSRAPSSAHPKSAAAPVRLAKPSPPPAAAPADAAGAGGAYMVQLGSFASRANADRFAQKLKGQGFNASVSQSSSGRHLYRVRAGPAHDHAAAVQLQTKLQAAGHVGAIVPK